MQQIANAVGYSETALLMPIAHRTFNVRYFSPVAEVPFCGHATIASAVALAMREGPGDFMFSTKNGDVAVETRIRTNGELVATFTSVQPRVEMPSRALVLSALSCLGWITESRLVSTGGPDYSDRARPPSLVRTTFRQSTRQGTSPRTR